VNSPTTLNRETTDTKSAKENKENLGVLGDLAVKKLQTCSTTLIGDTTQIVNRD